jgi:hypothetical protein
MPAKKKSTAKKAAPKRTYKDGNKGKKGEPPNQKRRTARAIKVEKMRQKKKEDSLFKAMEETRAKNKGKNKN